MDQPDIVAVEDYLRGLQARICSAFEELDGGRFQEDAWERAAGGGGMTRILEGGDVLERAGVNFSHVTGERLPAAATARHPELAGAGFRALGLSLVVHPRNPYVPTAHANLRLFVATPPEAASVWWFGGGYDLTPCYPFEEDVLHWHRTAEQACRPFGEEIYPDFKAACDDYFYLPHRGETRGVGGLFFDDYRDGGFDAGFALVRSIGDSFLPAYTPIVERRRSASYGERERTFQQYRRGRYVEFNLVFDRGTLFGLQSGGRTESILMSMPPMASWRYDWQPGPDSPEARLFDYLHPRDWLRLD